MVSRAKTKALDLANARHFLQDTAPQSLRTVQFIDEQIEFVAALEEVYGQSESAAIVLERM